MFREFEKHFIDTGLVGDEFRALLARARGFAQGWEQAFDEVAEAVPTLLDRVELLFSTLDASLQFHPPEADTAAGSEPVGAPEEVPPKPAGSDAGTKEIDLRGVTCPMNFVKAKLQLEAIDTGETLTVILDDGEPVRNVPASFKSEGQSILETTDLGDGHWRVVVRKEK